MSSFDSPLHAELHQLHERHESAKKSAWEAQVHHHPNREQLEAERRERLADIVRKEKQLASAFILMFRSALKEDPDVLAGILREALPDVPQLAEAVAELEVRCG